MPAWPSEQWPWVVVAALMSSSGTLLFAWAYARGEASYLAVTEYSAFLWASALGWIVFHEPVSTYTLAGAALIVGGCLVAAAARAALRRRSTIPSLADPSTLMVNASTPMLNTKAARQWTVTTRRMRSLVMVTSDVWNVIPQREGEIDEVPVDRLRRAREIEPDAAASPA